MIKFFLGALAGAVLTMVICVIVLAFIGAYRENEEMKKKIKEYEEKENEGKRWESE